MSNVLEVLGVSELVSWVKRSATSLLFERYELALHIGDRITAFLKRHAIELYEDGMRVSWVRHRKLETANLTYARGTCKAFLYNGVPIFLTNDSESADHTPVISIYAPRVPKTWFDIKAFINHGMDVYEREMTRRQDAPWVTTRVAGSECPSQPLSDSELMRSFRPESYQVEVIREVSQWIDLQDWYAQRQIPHQRGYLFHGKPGTGKTRFVEALAGLFNLDLNVFNLSGMSNEELLRTWERGSAVPSITLIEDIDAVFHGRKNVSKSPERTLTWDTFINAISGISKDSHRLLIITTNRPEVVDSSLAAVVDGKVVTRPGRIDKAVEFTALSREGREWIVNVILKLYGDDTASLVARGEGMTGAQFTELCVQEALKGVWGLPSLRIVEKSESV